MLRRMYLDQPNEVSLETLTLCNAACTFCPYPTSERKGERMSDALIDKLVGEMAGWKVPFMFSPFKLNEPLLDARTIPLCERINREVPKAGLRLFTNGSALTPEKIERIAGLKQVVHVWISLNSHIPEEYESVMGLSFEKTAKKLDYLHSVDFPHDVVMSTVGFPNEPFRRYCFDRWPKFESVAIKRDSWLGYTQSYSNDVPDVSCARWFELSITSSGKVALCCMDSEAAFSIGDVSTSTMMEVYNAPLYRERRERMLSRKQVTPCNTCTY